MDRTFMIAYSEVNAILNLLDEELLNKIPKKLRILISENKLNDYNVIIDPNIPLKEQKISREALSILAVLNYKYWCTEEKKKKKLLKKFNENERIKQEKMREKYNPDKIFKNTIETEIEENKEKIENKYLIEYDKKENFFIKIINKIKDILKLT